MSQTTIDLCVVGAGAAGLTAGIFAAEQSLRPTVLVLDGANHIGAKILVSGGGRCNVTHDAVRPEDFFGTRHLVRHVLASFSVEATVEWFASLGVELKREETGKLFPVTDKARTVLEALIGRCRTLDVGLRPGHRVVEIARIDGAEGANRTRPARFLVRHQEGEILARHVILATGGRSLPRSGSDGVGYGLARRLGHRVTPTVPALVALVLDETSFHRGLSGLSHEAELQTVVQGRPVDRRTGSLLWTHFGISGPVVMDASRWWCLAREQGLSVELYGNFLPGRTPDQAREWFLAQTAEQPRRALAKLLAGPIPERFAGALCLHVGADPQQASAQVPRATRERLLAGLTRFRFPVRRDRGWNFAEVTAGGIPLEEVDFRTMESKLVPGLYVIGELLDCDGRIGGFNFQWAWSTGRAAGRAAAASLHAMGDPVT
jgi:predicted Rossmann fold flavoprotein